MVKINFNDTSIDLSKLEVGKEFNLNFTGLCNGKEIDINVPRALIKSIDIENNSFEYKPLTEKLATIEYESNPFTFEMIDTQTNEVVLKG